MISFTKIVFLIFIAYVCNSVYVIYTLFNPESCGKNTKSCLRSRYKLEDLNKLKVSIYVSKLSTCRESDVYPVWDSGEDSVLKVQQIDVNISLPFSTRRNGTLYACVFVHPSSEDPYKSLYSRTGHYQYHQLSKYIVPKDKSFNLIQGAKEKNIGVPITHIHKKLSIYLSTQTVSFNRQAIPSDLYHLFSLDNSGDYLPLLYIDGLSTLDRHLIPVTKNTSRVPVSIYFTPVTIGRLRIWSNVQQTMGKMKELGFTDNDLDDMKGIFTDTNLYFLALTFTVAAVHMLFDVLAFKNDVSFWRKKESMEGMSTRTVIWRCVSTAIIFLYLMNEKTSLLVLVPAGIGAIIEFWKVTKALKVEIYWNGKIPKIKFGSRSKTEQETEEFDEQAMKYLSYALYPLLAAGSVYSLVYHPHKSWYSWIINSLVNGVYAFGFLFMLPQLFVNYKLKSVAHLPWRAFMYKAFNTFIDDIFAFIITMPTAHRLACFRDDLVFLVYLYQRWLYPVDKTRANEYGMVFEEPTERRGTNKQNTKDETESKKNR